MTKKRFDLVCDDNVEWLMQSELFLPIWDKYTNKKITLKQCYDLLNSLAQEEHLKRSDEIIYLEIMIKKLKEENKKLQSQIHSEHIYFGYLKILEDWNKKVEKENKKLKRENEYLNSEAIRLHKEVYCMDCFTCRHSESINIDVKCAEGEKKYHRYCDFYEISEEWVE